MARIVPDDIDESVLTTFRSNEFKTLKRLRDDLPDEYTVYHAVHWSHIEGHQPQYGEIDFIVANRYGKLLVIEQKDANVYVDENDLKVNYSRHAGKSVLSQVNRNVQKLRQLFSQRFPNTFLFVDYLLYLPRSYLTGQLPASVDASRVVDAHRDDVLCHVIEDIFDLIPMVSSAHPADPLKVHDFLSDRVQAQPHIGLLGQHAQQTTAHMSGGLATWASRLTLSPNRLHVRGTAGSGKTQLALQTLKRLANQPDALCIYLCYNRPLADAIKQVAPANAQVLTVHELGRQLATQANRPITFDDPNVFDKMIEALVQWAPKVGPLFDVLVIDEAQDMTVEWMEALLSMAKPSGQVLVLDDPEQTLYDRLPFVPQEWPRLESPVNYRSTRKLVDFMNFLQLTDVPIEAGSAVVGFDPQWHVYSDQRSLIDRTAFALQTLIKQGYTHDTIAILTYQSTQNSVFFNDPSLKELAATALKKPSGYGANSEPLYTEGQVLLDSLRRFKGQAAHAVILTEVDFKALDVINRRKLFVGLSRARLHAVLVTSEQAAQAILRQIEGK